MKSLEIELNELAAERNIDLPALCRDAGECFTPGVFATEEEIRSGAERETTE